MANSLRMAAAGVLLAVLVSAGTFLVFPPGVRMELADGEIGATEATFALRGPQRSFRPVSKDETAAPLTAGPSLADLYQTLQESYFSVQLTRPRLEPTPNLVTQELIAYASASAMVTALSLTEQDIVIPSYASALRSAQQRLDEVVGEAASSKASVERAHNILMVSSFLVQGESFSSLPESAKAYARDVGLANPEALFSWQGTERFRFSLPLSRLQASVTWASYATSFERSRDVSCLAVLGFVVAEDISTWSKLSGFYKGLLGWESVDSVELASIAVSVFGHSLTEEELTDPALLSRFSESLGEDPWAFPFEISLSGTAPDIYSLTSDLPDSLSLFDRVSELRSRYAAMELDREGQAASLGGIWLIQLLSATWDAPNERTVNAIAGAYGLLLYSSPTGLDVGFVSNRTILVEINPSLYSRLDAAIVGLHDYIASTIGISNGAGAVLLAAHDVVGSISQEQSSSAPVMPLERSLVEKLSLLLKVSGLTLAVNWRTDLGEAMRSVTVTLIVERMDGTIGLIYLVAEVSEEG